MKGHWENCPLKTLVNNFGTLSSSWTKDSFLLRNIFFFFLRTQNRQARNLAWSYNWQPTVFITAVPLFCNFFFFPEVILRSRSWRGGARAGVGGPPGLSPPLSLSLLDSVPVNLWGLIYVKWGNDHSSKLGWDSYRNRFLFFFSHSEVRCHQILKIVLLLLLLFFFPLNGSVPRRTQSINR